MTALNLNKGNKSGGLLGRFSSQQIKAIKDSPKGKLPPFISGGTYNEDGITSIGGRIGRPGSGRQVGATIGLDKGKPFGSANVNGKTIGKFGPQGK